MLKGLQGSVMDYPAVNVSTDRSKQGDYYTTKAGPYDLWAIEFGYTPFQSFRRRQQVWKKSSIVVMSLVFYLEMMLMTCVHLVVAESTPG
jgi:hypothetical protein